MKTPNLRNARTLSRFSIRKCSVGTASFLIGTVAFFGIHHEAFAAENSTTPVTVTQLQEGSNKASAEEQADSQTKVNETSIDESTATAEQPKTEIAPTQDQEVTEKEATPTEQTSDAASSEVKDSTTQAEESPKEADVAQTEEKQNEATETLQSESPDNTSNQEVEKESVSSTQEKPNAQQEAKTPSNSQITRSSQQDTSTTTPSPQTNDQQLPTNDEPSGETSTSNSTLNEQPTESTPISDKTVKTEEVDATQNAVTAPRQLKTVKGTTQLRAVNATAVTPAAAGGTNVNDKVTASEMGISESYIEPNNSGSFYLKSRFTVDGTVKEGDYFTIKMPNTVNTYGDTRFSPDYREKLKNSNGHVIALGEYDVDSHTLTYRFTDVVNNLQNVSGSFNLTQFMDRQVAKDSATYPLNYEIAGETFDTQLNVHYGQYYNVGDSNLKSMITMEDPKTGEYEQYIYVNPLQKEAYGTVVRVQGFQNDPAASNGQVNPDATQIKILKVADGQALNSSFGVDDSQYEDVTKQFQTIYRNGENMADIFLGDLHGARYIIKVSSKEVSGSSEDLNLRASMYTKNRYNQYDRITWDNNILKSSSSGTADGTEASYQLGDKVWDDTNKNGIQDAGELGIPGVKVTLKDSDGKVIEHTETNANGKYVFDNLKNGIYTVDFETPEGYTASPQNQGNDALDSDGPTSARGIISDGNNLTVDQGFYLTEIPTQNVGDKVWEDLNKDGIQDDDEPGIANVTVTLKDADGNIVGTRTTDDKGNYLFEDVKEGEYTIDFETPEGYTPTITGQGTLGRDSNGVSARILVGNRDDLTIDSGFYKTEPPVPPTRNIGDKVWEDTNKDGIQDADEPGIADVTVTLKDADGNVVDTRVTDTNGNYLFENVKQGEYTVEFETPEGYTPTQTGQGSTENDSNGTSTKVTVSDNDDLTLDSGFYKTEPPVPPTRNIGDKVWEDTNKDGIQDADEPGIANVTVTLKDADGNVVDTRVTDTNGNYLFENVKQGEYTVEFETPEGYTPTQTGQGSTENDSNGTSTKVTVGDNDDLTLDSGFYKTEPPVPPTRNIGDKVWEDTNKDGIQDADEPGIANVTVTLTDADGNVVGTRTTDTNGNYLFEDVKPGDYTVTFETPEGYTPTQTGQGTADNDSNGTSTKVTVGDSDDLSLDSGFYKETPEPPTEPDNPDPDQPTDPGQPDNPDPDQPTDPGQPDNPSPEQPSEPGQPDNPSPEQPSEPGQPDNPSPEQPSEPGQPNNPTPEQPNHPGVPSTQNPEQPESTDATQSKTHGEKVNPSQPQKALPETGETESHQGTLFGGILAALGALLFARKKRQDKKQSH
ncbi:SdrD B-like domain-containing protein [Staphylococcus delphini]|uniref:SdrD B-like domain-containing protein n=1 Tax=Staphylococcus delphini TaxID=53344 RepID=UPI0023B29EE4|nr:SdrD B-like domain-containing protein [Staphylococcus delphini]MDE9799885.1 carboxypeptidase regulatory-like domain-containing protein [Staphylococcus delphini]MDE9807328.1 carboxypeptidase regulatory-like domain-containing protein [Staphylococcus delphini]